MTQILARSALVLFATTALGACATPTYAVSLTSPPARAPMAAHEPPGMLVRAVDRGDLAPPELIFAATHRRHHVAAKPAPAEDEAPATYKVKKGDTLAKVADRLGVTIAELKTANHLKGTALDVGQVLKVPGAEPKPAAHKAKARPEKPTTYEVKRGDTLFSISKRLGVSVEDLRAANDLSARASIRAGETLKLPGAEEAAEPEAPPPSKGKGRRKSAVAEEADTGEGGRAAAGRVVEVEGAPATYKVKKGDTLEKIADKLDTDIASLKKDNRIKGSTIRPGQVLKGPRATSKAYVARSGDTLADIAQRFGVTTEHLRKANGLRRGASVRSGQKLVLPAGYRDRGPVSVPSRVQEERPSLPVRSRVSPTTAVSDEVDQPATPSTAPRPYTPGPAVTPRPYTPPTVAPRPYVPPATGGGPPLAPQAAPPPTDAQISELGRGRFRWPLTGEILSDFGPKTLGQRNDGINIRANAGDPVRSAASGDIVYAGDQVPGFGNLVLIKHADGWVTAYGHLSRVEVKMQQKVSQGQEIGEAGSTGGVSEPQLHFEVRYAPNPLERARPIDPKLVLPR